MSTKESYVLVNCEQLVSYRLRQRPATSPSLAHIELKNRSLGNLIHKLSTNPNVSIIVVTACPYTRLIEDYLKWRLPEASFSMFYAPPLHPSKKETQKAVAQNEKFKQTEASISPPPGYTLLINHTLFSTEEALQRYTIIFLQRLLQTNRFYDTKELERQELECQELERQELERQELERKELEQKELKQYGKERSFSRGFFRNFPVVNKQVAMTESPPPLQKVGSPTHFKTIAKISSEARITITGISPIQRILQGEASSSSPRGKLSAS